MWCFTVSWGVVPGLKNLFNTLITEIVDTGTQRLSREARVYGMRARKWKTNLGTWKFRHLRNSPLLRRYRPGKSEACFDSECNQSRYRRRFDPAFNGDPAIRSELWLLILPCPWGEIQQRRSILCLIPSFQFR